MKDEVQRKTITFTNLDLHKEIRVLAAEKGVSAEVIIMEAINLLTAQRKAVK